MARPIYYAVLADIHANLAALRAVARAARVLAATDGALLRFISLGDVVGYGPQPAECVAWIHRHAAWAVVGNHDEMSLATGPPLESDPRLWPMIFWTRAALTERARAVLVGWPRANSLGPFTLYHSSLAHHNTYIRTISAARDDLVALPTPYGLFGHTHFQMLFAAEATRPTVWVAVPPTIHAPVLGLELAPTEVWHDLPPLGALINPGSVGQPRQLPAVVAAGIPNDVRAAYALLRLARGQSWQVRFERAAYPVVHTIDRLRALARRRPPAAALPENSPYPSAFAEGADDLPAVIEYLVAQLTASQ